MSNVYNPVIFPASVDSVGTLVDFSSIGEMGRTAIQNLGSGDVYCSFEAIPPSAAVQNGVFKLPMNSALNLAGIKFLKLGFICPVGQTATVQTVSTQSMGGPGGFSG